MDETTQAALNNDRIIDITTIGRKSGQPRRIEIWFHNLNGRIFITGLPGRRNWYANMLANPEITFHLKETIQADLAAKVIPITAAGPKREVLSGIVKKLDRGDDLEKWVAESPLVEVTFI